MTEIDRQKDTKQFITWGLLALCCFLLAGILLTLHKVHSGNDQVGRYTMSFNDWDGIQTIYVLDTKTGRVRYGNRFGQVVHGNGSFNLGTPEPFGKNDEIIPEDFKLKNSNKP